MNNARLLALLLLVGLLCSVLTLVVINKRWPNRQESVKSPLERALTGTPAVQRFIPISQPAIGPGNLAFDTQTGRLCKTWLWGTDDPISKAVSLCTVMLVDDEEWVETLRKKAEKRK